MLDSGCKTLLKSFKDFFYSRLSSLSSCFYSRFSLLASKRSPSERTGLGSSPFARRYLENRFFFLFLGVLRCFSSPGYLLTAYVFSCGYLSITSGEFPHSDILGSTVVCTSPGLIAACHVLLRLLVPRHSPYALICLTNLTGSFFAAALIFYNCEIVLRFSSFTALFSFQGTNLDA